MPKTAQRGLTLIEAIIVIGLTAALLGIVVINLVRPQARNSVEVTTTTLVADLKQTQLLTMMGDSGSQANAQSHGVRLTASNYTLFTGASFATSTDQLTITLPQGITISAGSLPLDIIFTVRTGETSTVTGVIVRDTGGDSRSLTINRLGAIIVN